MTIIKYSLSDNSIKNLNLNQISKHLRNVYDTTTLINIGVKAIRETFLKSNKKEIHSGTFYLKNDRIKFVIDK